MCGRPIAAWHGSVALCYTVRLCSQSVSERVLMSVVGRALCRAERSVNSTRRRLDATLTMNDGLRALHSTSTPPPVPPTLAQ